MPVEPIYHRFDNGWEVIVDVCNGWYRWTVYKTFGGVKVLMRTRRAVDEKHAMSMAYEFVNGHIRNRGATI